MKYEIKRKRYNSKLDIKSTFNTIRISEMDINKTGFVMPDVHFEFPRMPFDVTNGPSTTARQRYCWPRTRNDCKTYGRSGHKCSMYNRLWLIGTSADSNHTVGNCGR
ncbi:hypothetical protein NPIL_459971 [Nephila pilipes]|uniref:Uncharacterized protein n=1 Tax=Nephila pilipes TaxID=299642 RepID=A0A8X6PAT4_NEPPI|nr:hypothetical protein NPIL_459971 [Nephila pilipes]